WRKRGGASACTAACRMPTPEVRPRRWCENPFSHHSLRESLPARHLRVLHPSDGPPAATRDACLPRVVTITNAPLPAWAAGSVERIVMLWSRFFIPTSKEIPSDAVVPSHQLLIRAGLVRQV